MKTILETQTPLSPNLEKYIECLSGLENFGGLILDENGGINPILAAERLMERCEKEIFLKISCRDRNRIALHSRLLSAAAIALPNILMVDGTYPLYTRFPAAKPVYELDSLNLLRMLKLDSPKFGGEGVPPLSSIKWTVGVHIGGSTSADMLRAKKFLDAGADLFFVNSLDTVPMLREFIDKPLIVSCREEQAKDFSAILRQAESAAADGVNLVVNSTEKVLDGSLARR